MSAIRKMIEAGLPVAMASDYNPGTSPSGNMQLILSMACIRYRLTPEEALNAAAKIGDDYLQKQAYGRTMPETFNHGTSAQRSKWLKKGIATGDIRQGDTFSPAYSAL